MMAGSSGVAASIHAVEAGASRTVSNRMSPSGDRAAATVRSRTEAIPRNCQRVPFQHTDSGVAPVPTAVAGNTGTSRVAGTTVATARASFPPAPTACDAGLAITSGRLLSTPGRAIQPAKRSNRHRGLVQRFLSMTIQAAGPEALPSCFRTGVPPGARLWRSLLECRDQRASRPFAGLGRAQPCFLRRVINDGHGYQTMVGSGASSLVGAAIPPGKRRSRCSMIAIAGSAVSTAAA